MRTGATQLAGGLPKAYITIGSDTYWTEGGNSGSQERIVTLTTNEQVFGGQYTVLLDNSDEALNAKDFTGKVVSIYWGFVSSAGSNMCKMWVDTQHMISQEGKLLLQLDILDAFGMMSKMSGQPYGSYWNYPWQASAYLDTLSLPSSDSTPLPPDLKTKISSHYGKTLQQIIDGTMDDAFSSSIDIVWSDIASDTSLNSSSIEPALTATDPRSLVASALACSKSYLLFKADGKFYQVAPDAHSQVYSYANGTYNNSDTDSKQVITPNRVIVWFIAKNPTDVTPTDGTINPLDSTTWKWANKVATDSASYTLLGYYVDQQYNTEFELIDTLTAAQAQAKADSLLAQIQLSTTTGSLVAPMHCSQELFDIVGISDDRYTGGRGITGYVFGILREYNRGVYKITLQLGGVVTGYTPPKGADVNITQPPQPVTKPDPPAPVITWSSLLPKAIQGYDSTVVFYVTDRTNVGWNAGVLKFYDGTTQSISAGTFAIPNASVYTIYFDLADASPNVLKTSSSFQSVYTQYTDSLAIVERGSSTLVPATLIPSRGKIPLITADHLSMYGVYSGTDTSGNTYQMVSSSDFSAGHIALSSTTTDTTHRTTTDAQQSSWTGKPDSMDNIADGSTYKKVLATQIDAGKLKLTSDTTKSGKWYSSSGVVIDADAGINIFGTANALTTRATETGTIQCYVGADGKLYAGAGAVILDSSGLTIKGTGTTKFVGFADDSSVLQGGFYYQGATYGVVFAGVNYPLTLQGGGGTVYCNSSLYPLAETQNCGNTNADGHWNYVVANNFTSDNNSYGSFHAHPDIAMVRNIGYKTIKEKKKVLKASLNEPSIKPEYEEVETGNTIDVIDPVTLPPEMLLPRDIDPTGTYISATNMISLALGAISKLADQVDSLQYQIDKLNKGG